MGLFDSIFGNKTSQTSQTSGSQQGTTSNNLWPGMQDFLAQYQQQFSGPSINTVNPGINQYQTGAADNQVDVAGNPALGTGFNTASNIAQNGLTPAAIQAQMSPYVQNVVNPTIAAQNLQNQQALGNLAGNHATRGALGNNTGSAAAYMAGVQPAQQAQIAGLYDTGFRGAQQAALGSIGTQLQGTGAIGSLTGANTNANVGLGGLGQNIWQSSLTGNMTPFQLSNQGVQGFQGLGSLAGTNFSGSNQGTSNTQGTQTQNPFQTALGVLGLGMTGWGGFGKASGGRVVSKAEGGAVTGMDPIPFHEKVAQAFQAVDKMRAGGGRIEEDKGELRHMNDRLAPMGAGRFASRGFAARVGGLDPWTTDITPVSDMEANGQDPFMPIRGYDGGGVVDPFAGGWNAAQPFGGFNSSGPFTRERPNNTSYLGGLMAGDPLRQFGGYPELTTQPLIDRGGDMNANNTFTSSDLARGLPQQSPQPNTNPTGGGGGPPPIPMADTSGYRSTILPMRAENGFRGFGQMATALMGASAHTQGMAQNIMAQQGVRNADRMAELQAGQLLGSIGGQRTLEAQRLPSQIALQEAQTEAARVAADREFQSRLRREEAEHARALELQKLEAQMQLLARLQGQMQGGGGQPNANGQAPPNTVREWTGTPRGLEPPTTAPVTAPPAQQSPPPIPFNNADPLTGSRYGSFASPYTYVERNRAGRGEHYIGEDGISIYKRGGGNGRTGRTEDVYVGPYDADQARRLRTGGQ